MLTWQQSSWLDQGFAVISPQGYFSDGIWDDLALGVRREGQCGSPPSPVTPRNVLECFQEEMWLSQRPPQCCFCQLLLWDFSHKVPLCVKKKDIDVGLQDLSKLERHGVVPCLISSIQTLPPSAKLSLIARSENITVLL